MWDSLSILVGLVGGALLGWYFGGRLERERVKLLLWEQKSREVTHAQTLLSLQEKLSQTRSRLQKAENALQMKGNELKKTVTGQANQIEDFERQLESTVGDLETARSSVARLEEGLAVPGRPTRARCGVQAPRWRTIESRWATTPAGNN